MHRGLWLAGLTLLASPAAARAEEPKGPAEKPRECVAFARTWAAALDEARLLCGPIVVHCLDFDASATWGYQGAVLCNKKYMDAAHGTVDVMGMIHLEKAVARRDKRARTYAATVDGVEVKFLAEFPGLTVEDAVGMTASTAKYDTTGYAPFTAFVDPWTEVTMRHWSGGQSAHSMVDGVAEARKRLEKEHGKGASKKDARAALLARGAAKEQTDRGEFATALKSLALASAATEKAPDGVRKFLDGVRATVIAAAEKALVAVETEATANPAAAKPHAVDLLPRLAGTGLEPRAKALLAKLG
jgi:hypothetical protein